MPIDIQLKDLIRCTLILALALTLAKSSKFKILYEWTQIEFEFGSDDERAAAINNGTFAEGQIQPIDVQYTNIENAKTPERIFITTPRLADSGIPASLSVVTDKNRNGNPVVRPYPSWSWHVNPENCQAERIVSVFRVWTDQCCRLWVMDNGIIGATFICSPQLLVFDLKMDELLHKYEIPYDQHKNTSWFLTPIVEVDSKSCSEAWVYVADPSAPSLLVYSLELNRSWSIKDSSFEADSNWTTFNIMGDSFTVAHGILTVALSPSSQDGERKLAYHSMSGIKESFAYTKYLKNESNFDGDYSDLFQTYQRTRNQQSCIEAYDSKGNLYFSLLIDVQIAKWNSKTSYNQNNFEIICDDTETMQFPTGLKVGPYQKGEALWVFATAFQRFASGTLSGNQTNFRILFTEL